MAYARYRRPVTAGRGSILDLALQQDHEARLLDQAGITAWQIKIALVLVPTVVYGILFVGQQFPATERVQSGISFGGMVRAIFGHGEVQVRHRFFTDAKSFDGYCRETALLPGEVGLYDTDTDTGTNADAESPLLIVSYANGLRLSLRAAKRLAERGIRARRNPEEDRRK